MRTKMKAMCLLSAAALLLTASLTSTASASIVTLSDANSVASIDTASSAGMFNWRVDGKNQLFQQWFWYRIGNTAEQSIDTIGSASVSQLDPSQANISYTNNLLTVLVKYALTGGTAGSGTADIAETIKITNNSSSAISLSFFQYSDFDLNGGPGNQTITMDNHVAHQAGNGSMLSETVVTPGASHFEAGVFASTLNKLSDGVATTLNGTTTATGDATWAYEWDRTIGAGGSFIISKDKNIAAVPEPGTMMLLGAGFLGLAIYGKRRRNG